MIFEWAIPYLLDPQAFLSVYISVSVRFFGREPAGAFSARRARAREIAGRGEETPAN